MFNRGRLGEEGSGATAELTNLQHEMPLTPACPRRGYTVLFHQKHRVLHTLITLLSPIHIWMDGWVHTAEKCFNRVQSNEGKIVVCAGGRH